MLNIATSPRLKHLAGTTALRYRIPALVGCFPTNWK